MSPPLGPVSRPSALQQIAALRQRQAATLASGELPPEKDLVYPPMVDDHGRWLLPPGIDGSLDRFLDYHLERCGLPSPYHAPRAAPFDPTSVLLPGVVNAGNFVNSLPRTGNNHAPAPSVTPIPDTTHRGRAAPPATHDPSPGLYPRPQQLPPLLRRDSSLSNYDPTVGLPAPQPTHHPHVPDHHVQDFDPMHMAHLQTQAAFETDAHGNFAKPAPVYGGYNPNDPEQVAKYEQLLMDAYEKQMKDFSHELRDLSQLNGCVHPPP